ncbi:beta-ketoacyl-ACP synthase III [Cetobacterium somerae]|uniref:beta-ketoacyl-ACP synthase III n=1 Tax=Cetobacterium TaxID=180162 RepID=UPI002E7BED77|nr:beta-ketoacyl-ACP synthase III [Cetobacterium somerae]WVJ00694.1 beta-ketoacyl-ACP synthase III [Cetobacterium somerae]
MFNTGILSIGSYIPKKKLTNFDLEKILDTTNEWIIERTGIKERYIVEEEKASDMALKAVENMLEKRIVKKEEIEMIILSTATPDYNGYPSTACILQSKLELKDIPCFDITAACSGLIYAISIANAYIKSGIYKKILVVGVEKNSDILDWNDRNTAVLFGDGATAIVVSSDSKNIIQNIETSSNGENYKVLIVDPFIKMEGKEVFKYAVKEGSRLIEKSLNKLKLSKEDISMYIPHQANIRIIDGISKKLKINKKLFYSNVEKFGNTSSASIGIALDEVIKKELLNVNSKVVLFAFGAGLSSGIVLFEYNEKI